MSRKKVRCPECKGEGGFTIPVMFMGLGPWDECGLCLGRGKISRKLMWFYYKEKKKARKQL